MLIRQFKYNSTVIYAEKLATITRITKSDTLHLFSFQTPIKLL